MRVIVVTPPAPVVTYAEAVARLKLAGGAGEQTDVESMIAGATEMFDGPDGWLGRAIGEQTLELRCDAFHDCDGDPLKLPYPPIAAIVSVKYLDQSGVEQTLAGGGYELVGQDLLPSLDGSLPTPRARRESVRIRYSAGYDVVPQRIKNAILLAVGDMYRFRETLAVTTVDELPSAANINSLVGGLRIYS